MTFLNTDSSADPFRLLAQGKGREAYHCFQVRLCSDKCNPQLMFGAACAALSLGRSKDAIFYLKTYQDQFGCDEQSRIALAKAYFQSGAYNAALPLLRQLVGCVPNNGLLLSLLGYAIWKNGDYEEAIAFAERACGNPFTTFEANVLLGNMLREQGFISQALSKYEAALRIRPSDLTTRSLYLFTLLFSDNHSVSSICASHFEWGARLQDSVLIQGLPAVAHHEGPLRIGFVSPDLVQMEHPVVKCLLPILNSSLSNELSISVYSSGVGDLTSFTSALKKDLNVNDISGLCYDEIRYLVNERDRVDIMIDLAGHATGNSLHLFAAGLAPVQCTYLGYLYTTGLRSVAYRITDSVCDPVNVAEFYSERLIYLPHSFLCYQKPSLLPAVTEAPSLGNGFITFGSFNSLSKLSPTTLRLWTGVLQEVPTGRLILKTPVVVSASRKRDIYDQFSLCGISPDRLDILSPTRNFETHLSIYNNVDICLDSYPYNGTTTTIEALLMGVPVVSLSGEAHWSRTSRSILSEVGLADLATESSNAFVAKAVHLAGAEAMRAQLRGDLRRRVLLTLCNEERFATSFKSSIEEIWMLAQKR